MRTARSEQTTGWLGGGHYTACSRLDPRDAASWFRFNDGAVSRISADAVVTKDAYVLFYARRGAPLRWGGLRPSPPIESSVELPKGVGAAAVERPHSSVTRASARMCESRASFGFARGFLLPKARRRHA